MGTEVLRPQDCLTQRIRVAPAGYHRRKNYNGNGNGVPKVNYVNRKPAVRSDWPEQRRKSPGPTVSKRSSSADDLRSKQAQNNKSDLVLGQVTILRRGESLDTKIKASQKKSSEEMTVYGTGRLDSDPKMVRKQVRVGLTDTYAGSAFSMSPSPKALPLPSFFNKKEVANIIDDSATKDLRRLLRLD